MRCKEKEGVVYKIVCDVPTSHVVYVGQTTQSLSERLSHHAALQKHPTKINQLIRSIGVEHFAILPIEVSSDSAYRLEREAYWTTFWGCDKLGFNVRVANKVQAKECLSRSLNSYRNRAVICDNDSKLFRSCSSAAAAYGVSVADVVDCCARRLRQTKGLRFRFANESREKYTTWWTSGIVRNRRVVCVETGYTWDSALHAAKCLGVSRSSVTKACHKGNALRKSKMHLKFEEI